jgi:hypothetical protein
MRAVSALAVRSVTELQYSRQVATTMVQNPLGAGQQLVARCTDTKRQLDFEVCVTLYEGWQICVVEGFCRNASSSQPIVVRSLEPVRALAEDSGGCVWPGATKVLTNGLMYYDPGKVKDLAATDKTKSFWNVGLYAGEGHEGLVAGYLRNHASLGQVTVYPGTADASSGVREVISLLAESTYQREFVLPPGARISSDPFAFVIAPNAFAALEEYAQAIGTLHKVRLNPPINGWCSWFSFYGAITEEEVVRQAEFVARRLKPYGCDTIQLDDGFYRAFGDWEGNQKFPHGMKWLAQRFAVWVSSLAFGSPRMSSPRAPKCSVCTRTGWCGTRTAPSNRSARLRPGHGFMRWTSPIPARRIGYEASSTPPPTTGATTFSRLILWNGV